MPLEPNLGIATSILGPLSLASLTVLSVVAVWRRRLWFAFLPALTFLMLLAIYATPRPVWVHHFLGIDPFPHLAIGVMVGIVWRSAGRLGGRGIGVAVIKMTIVAIVFNLMTMAQFHQNAKKSGGSALWSDSAYELVKTAQQQFANRKIQIMDWGIYNQFYLLGAGRLRVYEPVYSLPQTQSPDQRMLELVSNPVNVLLLHSPKATASTYVSKALGEAATRAGVVIKSETGIRGRSGEVVFKFVEYYRQESIERPSPK